jgi:hypothetical protein
LIVARQVDAVKKRADRRNDLLHGAWIYFFDADELLRYAPSPHEKQEWFRETEQELKDFIERLKAAIDAMTELRFDVSPYLAVSGDKPPEAPSPKQPRNRRPGSPSRRRTPKQAQPQPPEPSSE